MTALTPYIAILCGATCAACAADDGEPMLPATHAPARCGVCATEYRFYQVPEPDPTTPAEEPGDANCPVCHRWLDPPDWANQVCEDCKPSDCAYCGVPTNRPFLNEGLACDMCAVSDVA